MFIRILFGCDEKAMLRAVVIEGEIGRQRNIISLATSSGGIFSHSSEEIVCRGA